MTKKRNAMAQTTSAIGTRPEHRQAHKQKSRQHLSWRLLLYLAELRSGADRKEHERGEDHQVHDALQNGGAPY